MTNAAFARPAATRSALVAGQVVVGPDRHHDDGSGRRPYLILQIADGMAYVIEFSHSRQGQWMTDELGGGSYLATRDFRTGQWMGQWVPSSICDRYSRQLTTPTRESALDYCATQFARLRR